MIPLINYRLMRLVETGIIQHKQDEDLPLAEICPVDLRSTERQLRNTDLLLTYKVIIAGYAIATIIFLFEVIFAFMLAWGKNRKRDTRKSEKKPQNLPVKNSSTQGQVNLLKGSSPTIDRSTENTLIQRRQQFINGRNYYEVTNRDGDRRFIPIRTPSAFLFQYTD